MAWKKNKMFEECCLNLEILYHNNKHISCKMLDHKQSLSYLLTIIDIRIIVHFHAHVFYVYKSHVLFNKMFLPCEDIIKNKLYGAPMESALAIIFYFKNY